jgi:hypothetical protein
MKTRTEKLMAMVMFTAIGLVILLSATSCGSAKSCHTKGYYVSKDIKKAQSKPRNY